MPRALTHAVVMKELDGVAVRLNAAGTTQPQRLALLRRQAELGDLRDALAGRSRAREANATIRHTP